MIENCVKLISMTMPVEEFREESSCEDANDVISYCARVSNPSNQSNFDTSDKLLKYCLRKAHWSVFEMADVTFEIKCTRDIGRQILRHRSFHYQEFSQRYASPKREDFITRECRFQDPKNRQNSISPDYDSCDEEIVTIANDWLEKQEEVLSKALEVYQWAIDHSIAKEQARVVLPEGMTPSTMYMKGTVRDWFHYTMIRMGEGTQKEHRIIATQIYNILSVKFPFIKEIDINERGH